LQRLFFGRDKDVDDGVDIGIAGFANFKRQGD
jgi:hypothetical protein